MSHKIFIETEEDYASGCELTDAAKRAYARNAKVCHLPIARRDERTVGTDHVIRVAGARATSSGRYRVGGVPRGASGRQVDGGPLVPGPWAYVYELAGVIDNHGGTGAESERMRANGTEHSLVPGDVIYFDDRTYKIALDGQGFVILKTR